MASKGEINRIAEMYKDRTIFISGATGFVGKVLLEKLLRTCPGIKRIYLLLRAKKGKSPEARIEEIFENVLYEKLKREHPEAIKKCFVIEGNVADEDLGISNKDRKILQEEVDFIYHSAATTRFDDTIKYAVTMNTRGTKYMLDLANQCKKLKLFIHVSTAYAFPLERKTYEKPYDPPANPHEVLNSVNWITEDTMSTFTKQLLGTCPNSYTFSKALAENLVYEQKGKIPVLIVRPSLVIPTFMDPLPGWCNNLQGPMGLFVGAGKGVIRSMYMNPHAHANLIPVDTAVNIILVTAWNYFSTPESPDKQYIYNVCVPSEEAQYNWEEIMNLGKEVIYNKVPFNMILWYPGGSITQNKIVHEIKFYLFQMIPAIFVDILLFCLGYKPVLYQIQRRIQKSGEMFEFYTLRDWDFDCSQLVKLRPLVNSKEKAIYNLDSQDHEAIKQYLLNCMMCVRRNNLKETDDMLPRAKMTMKVKQYIYIVCVPSEEAQYNWEEIMNLGKEVIYNKVPFNMILWYPGGSITQNKIVHEIKFYLFQMIPAIFVDILLFCLGYKPVLYQIQRRIQKSGEMFEFYTLRDWDFDCSQLVKLRPLVNSKEKAIYNLDSQDHEAIKQYLLNCMMCVRRNNLKETDDMLPRAKMTMKVMYVVDKVCKAIICFWFFYYLYNCVFGK